jgi:hypothetical protein
MNTELNLFQARAIRDYNLVCESDELRQALAGNKSETTDQAAMFFGQACGYCWLWGAQKVDNPSIDLLPNLIDALSRRISELTQELSDFEIQFSETILEEEAELLATEVLRQRMDAWACWIAIDQALQQVLWENRERGFSLLARQSALADLIDQWDLDLQARADLLAVACNTFLLENWSNHLVAPFSDVPPWWIDQGFWEGFQKA